MTKPKELIATRDQLDEAARAATAAKVEASRASSLATTIGTEEADELDERGGELWQQATDAYEEAVDRLVDLGRRFSGAPHETELAEATQLKKRARQLLASAQKLLDKADHLEATI